MLETIRRTDPDVNCETHRVIAEILAAESTTAWELGFARSLYQWHGALTPRQAAILGRIWRQRCGPRRGAPLEECSRDWVSGRYRLAPPMRRASMRRRING